MQLTIKIFSGILNVHPLGRLAQLVERFPYKEDVGSSSLSTPTIKKKKSKRLLFLCKNFRTVLDLSGYREFSFIDF